MSSAAKLRKLGRGTATIATAALVMTSFGPAALAWEDAAGNANLAKTASVGIVDKDVLTGGTQGATVVVAGQSGQSIADIQLVVPATYRQGDFIELSLPAATPQNERITWSAVPTVSVSGPYKLETEVKSTSDTPALDHSAAQGKAQAFVAGTNETAPDAPSITPTIQSSGQGDRVLRLTFNSDSDAENWNAKFGVRLGGLKLNLGEKATGKTGVGAKGEIVVTASARDKDGDLKSDFFRAGATPKATTVPAAVSRASINAATASLVKGNDVQAIGDVTIQAATGTFGGGDLQFTLTGATAAADAVKVTFYDASGNTIGTPQTAGVVGGVFTVLDANVDNNAVRAVASGLMATPTNADPVEITLNRAGAIEPVSGALDNSVNQSDIQADPRNAMVSIPVVDNDTRLAGASRYDTAVKIAKKVAQTNGGTQFKATDVYEADNVVVASGANFPDALSATYLAHVKQAPVLLVQPDNAPQVVRDFLYDHGVKRVFIVGGEGAVSNGVADGIAGRNATNIVESATDDDRVRETTDSKIQVTRLAGSNRFDTNRVVNTYAATSHAVGTTVSSYGKASVKTAIIANGLSPWDALAGGAMVRGVGGTSTGLPIVLTDGSSSFNSAALDQLAGLDIKRLIFVGGKGVLPESLETQAAGAGATSTRLGGDNRWQTAEHIGNFLVKDKTATSSNPNPGFGYNGTTPLLANGGINSAGRPDAGKWADALAAGPLAAASSNAIALTAAAYLPSDIEDFLRVNKTQFNNVTTLGGTDSVSDAVVVKARQTIN